MVDFVSGESTLSRLRKHGLSVSRSIFSAPVEGLTGLYLVVGFLWLLLPIVGPALAAQQEATLRDALARTYESNPELASQRAILRATDEQLPQAKEYWFRPFIGASGAADWEDEKSGSGFDAAGQNLDSSAYQLRSITPNLDLTLEFPLFRSGQTVYTIKTAEAAIDVGQWDLVSVEQDVLGRAAQAYAEVLLSRALVEVDKREVDSYMPLLQMAQSMYQSRTVTITDLAQVELELALARAGLANDEGALDIAEANYEAIVGMKPPDLAPLPRLDPGVSSLEEAEKFALKHNPLVRSAESSVDQARHAVSTRKTALLPTIGLTASYQDSWQRYDVLAPASSVGKGTQNARTGSVGVAATIPIYTGGVKYSYIREALQDETASELSLKNTKRGQLSALRGAWKERRALERVVEAYRSAISSARTSVEGKIREYKNGTTTMQEVLLVQEDLYGVLSNSATATNELFTSEVNLLRAMGSLTATSFELRVRRYDPEKNLRKVEDKLIGW